MADMNVIKTRHGRNSTGGGMVSGPKVHDAFAERMESTPSISPKPAPCIGNSSSKKGSRKGSSY